MQFMGFRVHKLSDVLKVNEDPFFVVDTNEMSCDKGTGDVTLGGREGRLTVQYYF